MWMRGVVLGQYDVMSLRSVRGARHGAAWSLLLAIVGARGRQPSAKSEALIISPRGHMPMALKVEQVARTSFDSVAVVENGCDAPGHVVSRNFK